MKLTAYTIASNCTDIIDLCDGILEIYAAKKTRRQNAKRIPAYYGQRELTLKRKLMKLMRRADRFDEYEIAKLESIDKDRCARHKYSEMAIHKNRKTNRFTENKHLAILHV